MVRPNTLILVMGFALLGCQTPGGAAPPSAAGTNQLQRTDPQAAGDSAQHNALALPPSGPPATTYKVNVTFHGMAALVTFTTPDGRSFSATSDSAGSDSPRQSPTEDVCDCPETQLWADTVAVGSGTISIQAKETGALRLGIAIYGRSAEDSKSWSSGTIRLRSGESQRFRLHLPVATQGDSLWAKPMP